VSSTDVLLNVALAARLFHASDGTGFADLIIDGHRETWPVRSKRFGAWLRQHYYERTWDAPNAAALNAALNVLEAQAQFDGPQRNVSVRLAEQDGLIYLDLADEFWRCVEIGPNGWRIAEDPPVRFRRSAGMQPLPLPLRGGSIESLAPFLNLASENDFMLVVAWSQPAKRDFTPRAPLKPLIRTTGATQSRTLSRPTRWRRACVRLWPTERNGREALPIFCWPAPMLRATPWLGTGLAGRRTPAHSLVGCAGRRPSSAHSGLRSSSAARGGWERGPSG
jgi:hypothetical protein